MSSPFSTFTEKEIEKSSRKKLSKKNRKNNIQEFFKWSTITFVATLGYIMIGANFKGLSYLDDKDWVSTDEDFYTIVQDTSGSITNIARGLSIYSAAVKNKFNNATGFAVHNSNKKGSPIEDSNHYLKYGDGDGDFTLQDNSFLTSILQFGPYEWENHISRNNNNGQFENFTYTKLSNVNMGIFNSIPNTLSATHNNSLFVNQYILSNSLLKSLITSSDISGNKTTIGGSNGNTTDNNGNTTDNNGNTTDNNGNTSDTSGNNNTIVEAMLGAIKPLKDILNYLKKDLKLFLWPFIVVSIILSSISLPLYNIGYSMYDIFANPRPTSGYGYNKFNENIKLSSVSDVDSSIKTIYAMFVENIRGFFSKGAKFNDEGVGRYFAKGFAFSLIILFGVPFHLIISILLNIPNFLFAAIDIVQKILFLLIPFAPWYFEMDQDKQNNAKNAASEFLKNKAPVAFGIWAFFSIIFAFTYLGNEFATGGILGLAAICIYFLDEKMKIFDNIMKSVFGSEDNKSTDDKQASGIFKSIYDLITTKPILSTIMISLVAAVVSLSVVAGIYLS